MSAVKNANRHLQMVGAAHNPIRFPHQLVEKRHPVMQRERYQGVVLNLVSLWTILLENKMYSPAAVHYSCLLIHGDHGSAILRPNPTFFNLSQEPIDASLISIHTKFNLLSSVHVLAWGTHSPVQCTKQLVVYVAVRARLQYCNPSWFYNHRLQCLWAMPLLHCPLKWFWDVNYDPQRPVKGYTCADRIS